MVTAYPQHLRGILNLLVFQCIAGYFDSLWQLLVTLVSVIYDLRLVLFVVAVDITILVLWSPWELLKTSRSSPSYPKDEIDGHYRSSTGRPCSTPQAYIPAPAVVKVDLAVIQQLVAQRLRLHVKVQGLERANTSLRRRIWFLEDRCDTLRADNAQRARDYESLIDANGALVAERDHLRWEHGKPVAEKDVLSAKLAVAIASGETLSSDVEGLHTQMDEVVPQKEILLRLESSRRETEVLHTENCRLIAEVGALKAELGDLRNSARSYAKLQVATDELKATKTALAQLHAKHELQRSCLEMCRASLNVANKDRTELRAMLIKHRAPPQPSDDNDGTLAVALKARNAEITQLKTALAERDAAKEEASQRVADLQTYVVGLEGVVEFLKQGTRSGRDRLSFENKSHSAMVAPKKQLSVLTQPPQLRLARSFSTCAETATVKVTSPTPNNPGPSIPLMLPSRSSTSSSPPSLSCPPHTSWV